jgi:hypothetical protein
MIQEKGIAALREDPPQATSSTFDAFQRMAAGKEARTIADKLADTNRPTWEQYKNENEDKLDLHGMEVRKMVEYRRELDRERERKLNAITNPGKKNAAIDSDSDDDR